MPLMLHSPFNIVYKAYLTLPAPQALFNRSHIYLHRFEERLCEQRLNTFSLSEDKVTMMRCSWYRPTLRKAYNFGIGLLGGMSTTE